MMSRNNQNENDFLVKDMKFEMVNNFKYVKENIIIKK